MLATDLRVNWQFFEVQEPPLACMHNVDRLQLWAEVIHVAAQRADGSDGCETAGKGSWLTRGSRLEHHAPKWALDLPGWCQYGPRKEGAGPCPRSRYQLWIVFGRLPGCNHLAHEFLLPFRLSCCLHVCNPEMRSPWSFLPWMRVPAV